METIRVNMTPCEDIKTIHASQNDNEAREWGFELHNNGEKIDSSSISDQLVFKAYKGGTEQILPTNGSTPTTSPFKGDIKYPQGLLSDQEFLYRESPTEEDGLAKITDIKGNTLVWNQQLLAPTTSASTTASADGSFRSNRCTFTYDSATRIITITSLENMGTSGFVFGLANGAPLVVGHKYLQMCDVQAPKTFNFVIGINGNTDVKTGLSANTYHHVSTIKEFVSGTNEFLFNFHSNNAWVGTETVYIKNAMLFDLTQMDLDISSPSDFTSLFPLPYYAYNQGTLLSFSGNGIKTVGKNLLPTQNLTKVGDNYRIGGSASYYHLPQGTYTFSSKGKKAYAYYQAENDSANNIIHDNSTLVGTFTLAEGNYRFWFYSPNSTADEFYDIQLEFGNQATSYEPYTESLLNLPISTYFPNGMKQAGDVYDELTPSKAITRIGSVDLGTLTWSYNEQYQCFITYPVLTDAKYVDSAVAPNFTSIYKTVSWSVGATDATQDMMSCFLSSANQLRIRNKNFTDATAFKSAMSSVYLYYELATPIETSFTTASLVTENAEIPLSNEDGTLIGKCTEELSENPGFIDAKIKLSDSDGDVYSNKIQLHIERSPQ